MKTGWITPSVVSIKIIVWLERKFLNQITNLKHKFLKRVSWMKHGRKTWFFFYPRVSTRTVPNFHNEKVQLVGMKKISSPCDHSVFQVLTILFQNCFEKVQDSRPPSLRHVGTRVPKKQKLYYFFSLSSSINRGARLSFSPSDSVDPELALIFLAHLLLLSKKKRKTKKSVVVVWSERYRGGRWKKKKSSISLFFFASPWWTVLRPGWRT